MNRAIPLLCLSFAFLTAHAQAVTPRIFGMNASAEDYTENPPPVGAVAGVVQGREGLLGLAVYGSPLYDFALVGRVAVFRFESDGSTVRSGSIDLTDRIGDEMYFGTALALDSGTAIVMSNTAMRVYQKENGTWQERSRNVPDSPNFNFAAGPLALKDGVLAIPMQDKRDGSAPLRVFIYEITKHGAARHVTTIRVGEESCSLTSLILRQHTLAVGVPCDNGTGAVYVYEQGKDASKWKLTDRIVPDEPKVSSRFGQSVDLRKGTLVVGAPTETQTIQPAPDSGDFTSGVGYVFKRNGSHWVQTQRVDPSLIGVDPRGGFGSTAAITGTRVAFSAPNSTTGRFEDFAYTDAFRWQGNDLVYDQSFQGSLGYGDYMHSTKHWLVIGQPGDTYGGEYASVISFEEDFP